MTVLTECPRADVLQRLLLGQTDPEEAESLETHVLHCARCTKTLHTLHGDDGLVTAMRHAR